MVSGLCRRESVLISACLLGVACRYDGARKPLPQALLEQLRERFYLIPVCPEIYGGLATPRPPAERQGLRVTAADGADVTAAYEAGAQQVLALAQFFACKLAILKEKSPSCGVGAIYDGTFTRTLIAADGVAAERLQANGLRVLGESQLAAFLQAE